MEVESGVVARAQGHIGADLLHPKEDAAVLAEVHLVVIQVGKEVQATDVIVVPVDILVEINDVVAMEMLDHHTDLDF